MKASRNSQPFAQSAAPSVALPFAGGFEFENDSRLRQLQDLAKDGDELAAQELELFAQLA